ncbi:hypothetical protein CIRMBP1284_01832 [Enterococcus cecorum]|uniref:hypothetical protein n=1 Tax=Lactobacillales TaxID=186826 RepID=UPI00148B956D|nr:hypothetical protein [Enterococcus cecorum]CAI3252810.1 hypothetical protein CIRMBP1261_00028 [Enterococcus cecorum]CAI3292884.1 hypothetical protein CIRMBP1252_00593 [Enterococcus cecorum]CAI3302523.1 hypothetical protein CIRMBP1227_00604 [Enterococcus cecorum]CAI3306735.1 hypothetical protein CIRMBP1249_00592 [Enterococcus cecorum]CAI3316356.1 hypothetical protein CIRMBP1260_00715 [Enterococcus cecorum]
MKLIEVLQKVANGEIEKGTKFILGDNLYIFNRDRFRAGNFYLDGRIFLNARDLNREVDLIPPKEKKYLVKFNMRWWIERFSYLNYYEKNESIELNTKQSSVFCKASFTKDELQSIQPVREFLEDMEGKYELIEVNDNEDD